MRILRGTFLPPRTQYSHLRASPWPVPHFCSSYVCCQDKFLLLTLGVNIGLHGAPTQVGRTEGCFLGLFISSALLSYKRSPCFDSQFFRTLPTATKTQSVKAWNTVALPFCCYDETLRTSKRQILKPCCEMLHLKSTRVDETKGSDLI